VPLELCNGRQHLALKVPRWGVVGGDRDVLDAPPALLHLALEEQREHQVACQPVGRVHEHDIERAEARRLAQPRQLRPFERRAAVPVVYELVHNLPPPSLRTLAEGAEL